MKHNENENSKDKAHSEEYFGPQRDYWWNLDYLGLLAQRWHLSRMKSILDVGCGHAHWGRLLFQFLENGAYFVGTDQEQKSLDEASRLFKRDYPHAHQCSFIRAEAEHLPFEDGEFDIVTCQTLLMHVGDPGIVLNEMARVTREGGLVICVEPNNYMNVLPDLIGLTHMASNEIAEILGLNISMLLGKKALGEGDATIGDQLPGLLQQASLADIKIFMADKAFPTLPPYDTIEQQEFIKQERDWYETETGPWDQQEARRYFLAGGGQPAQFRSAWMCLSKLHSIIRERIDKGTYQSAGGVHIYVASGRKC